MYKLENEMLESSETEIFSDSVTVKTVLFPPYFFPKEEIYLGFPLCKGELRQKLFQRQRGVIAVPFLFSHLQI